MDGTEAFGGAPNVSHCGLGGSGCDGDGRGAEDVEELVEEPGNSDTSNRFEVLRIRLMWNLDRRRNVWG